MSNICSAELDLRLRRKSLTNQMLGRLIKLEATGIRLRNGGAANVIARWRPIQTLIISVSGSALSTKSQQELNITKCGY